MKVLLINHYAGSPYHGMEYRPYYFGKEWIRQKHSVQIVAASFSHLRSRPPEGSLGITKENIDGLSYIWLKTPGYEGNGIRRVINIFAFLFQLFRYNQKIIYDNVPNVVIASSTYPLDIIPAYFISRKTNAKLIFEVHDLWPLTLIEIGSFKPHHPLIILFQIAENFAYRHADVVVSMLPKAAKYMQEHGMIAEKFLYVPNGIDLEDWENKRDPIPPIYERVISDARSAGCFLVGYFGTIGLANDLRLLLDAAKLLKDQPIKFLLVGNGGELNDLQKYAHENNLANVVFLPAVPKNCMPALLSKMDALYIGWKKSSIYRFGISPNKLLDYMMSARPVIHSIEAGNDPVAESGCGISVPPENPTLIAEAIMQLYHLPAQKRVEMGSRGKQYVIDNHDVSRLAGYMIEKIQSEQTNLDIVVTSSSS